MIRVMPAFDIGRGDCPHFLCISVVFHPFVDLGFCQAPNVLTRVGGSIAATGVNKIQATFVLEQDLFVTCGITVSTMDALFDELAGFGIVFLFADNFLHGSDLLSQTVGFENIIQYFGNNARDNSGKGLFLRQICSKRLDLKADFTKNSVKMNKMSDGFSRNRP